MKILNFRADKFYIFVPKNKNTMTTLSPESKLKLIKILKEDLAGYELQDAKDLKEIEAINENILLRGKQKERIKQDIKSLTDAPENIIGDKRGRTKRKVSFLTIALDWLKEHNRPFVNGELRVYYNERTGKKLNIDDFSVKAPQEVKKGTLKKQEFPTNPNGYRVCFGLPEWFTEDKLKQEYLEKIKVPLSQD